MEGEKYGVDLARWAQMSYVSRTEVNGSQGHLVPGIVA